MPVTVNGSVLTQQALIGTQPRTLTWTSTVLTAGDVLVVAVAQNGAVEFSSPAAPTGGTGLSWTTILDQQNTAAHFSRVTAWWSAIPSDQTSTITQVTSGTGANQHSTLGALYRLSGVDQITPVGSTDGFQGQTDPTGTDLQLTGTKTGSLIFLAASDWSAGTASITISISNTTSSVTDLNTLESGQFRGISARASQSSSTNQGTLDYSAATGDWAAIIFEIEAAADAGAYVPLNPGWFVEQGLWLPIVGGVESVVTNDVQVAAELASITLVAQDATVALGVNADPVALTFTGNDAVAALGAQAENVPITLAAQDATAAVAVNAGLAAITFTTNDATTALGVNADFAPINLVANDATVSVSGSTNALAECATWSIAAGDATAGVGASADVAQLTLSALAATVGIAASVEFVPLTIGALDAVGFGGSIVIDANGRVVVAQTVVSTVDAGSAASGQAGVFQTVVSDASGSPAASGASSVDPTSDGRAEVG